MMYGGTRFDDSDNGENDDNQAQREDSGKRGFLLPIDLQVPQESERQSHNE